MVNNPQLGVLPDQLCDGPVQVVAEQHAAPQHDRDQRLRDLREQPLADSEQHDHDHGNGVVARDHGRRTWARPRIQDIQVYGNNVYVQENPNREYGQGVSERAFKIRNYGTGGFTDVSVDSNTFVAVTQAGYMTDAAGGSAYFNGGNTNVVFSNNLFKGLVLGTTDPGSGYTAEGFAVDKSAPGESILFQGNTFESDVTGSQLGTGNSGSTTLTPAGLVIHGQRFPAILRGRASDLHLVPPRDWSSTTEQHCVHRLDLSERGYGGHHLGWNRAEGCRLWLGAEPDGDG